MKKIIAFLAIGTLLLGCKEEVVKKPERLIDKDVMINVMYDLSVLEAIKYQNPASLDTFKINPTQYIYKKYKIDSLQFAKSNIYYASDYEGYKVMFEQMTQRLEDNKKQVDSLLTIDKKKKKSLLLKKKKTPVIVKDTSRLKQNEAPF
ncbi:DUF4296 domain-containing protein [Flavobacterium sp. LS1P28]|uniref:DUF4296 domain-containing protein n=1 Tax=Flavobacterium bomense TaxID=2497483 RepID=A0A3S0N2D9_9FLAO|nr:MULTISPECIES: DUF4296 domain-containing protein [Flavobacterium]RTY70525.1 DUF4296 domain-containing protein [Flavobacterium sp. LB2P53]RTY82627.1 DUF4296 domain-containing protein [Flavobacterium sp. ZB4P23]RTY85078.1 DUF4296 domain-containing protein [Flavobacterium sp. LS1P28]RTY89941.1 DUF4296 domain-containing protein [Flavobacterium sp. RSP46]RTZ08185.1 DUF4296 domain-containing protein [Flavobacterium bomense]